MSIKCLVDNTEYETVKDLCEHLKEIKWSQKAYFYTYHPRFDKLTNEKIEFKNVEQYLSTDFVNKNNMRKWVLANPKEGREWAVNFLKQRKEAKQLIYAPSQAELRSLSCPSMSYFDSNGGYYNITKELGFKDRYIGHNPAFTFDISDAILIQDTREQSPIHLSLKTEVRKLDVGDYGLAPPHDKGIYIERKSLQDFVGSLSLRKVARKKKENDSSFERIDRELARAKESGHYVIMLVESDINDALGFEHLPWMRHGKTTASHIFHNLRELLNKYSLNFQVVFANGRKDAARKMIRIFQMGEQVKQIDLEYAAEQGLL